MQNSSLILPVIRFNVSFSRAGAEKGLRGVDEVQMFIFMGAKYSLLFAFLSFDDHKVTHFWLPFFRCSGCDEYSYSLFSHYFYQLRFFLFFFLDMDSS